MKRVKIKIAKKVRRFFIGKNHKYINGSRGVISIFLACMLVPFAYIADLLVESGRYNASMSIVDQTVSSAELSTLSEYDEYLLERFGFLAISQEESYDSVYKAYHEKCYKEVSESLDISVDAVKGLFALNDDDVLMRQIAEAGKYSIPAYFAGTTLSNLISKLEEMLSIDSFMETLTDAGDMTDTYVTFASEFDILINKVEDLETKKSSYDKAFDNFRDAVKKLAGKMGELESAISDRDSKQAVATSVQSSYNDCINKIMKYRDIVYNYGDSVLDDDKKNNILEYIDNIKSHPSDDSYCQDLIDYISDNDLGDKKIKFKEGTIEYEYDLGDIADNIKALGLKDKNTKKNNANSELSKANEKIEKINGELEPLRTSVNTKKGEYATAITNISTSLTNYKTQLGEVVTAKNKILEKGAEIAISTATDYVKEDDPDLKEWKKEKTNLTTKKNAETDESKKADYDKQIEALDKKIKGVEAEYDNAQNAAEGINDAANAAFEQEKTKGFFNQVETYKSLIDNAVSELEAIKGNVNNVDPYSNITSSTSIPERPTKSNYYISVDSCFSAKSYLEEVVKEFESSIENEEEEESGPIAKIKAIIGSLQGMIKAGGIYNADLTSFVKGSESFEESAIDGVLTAMSQMTAAVAELGKWNFKSIFTKIKNVIEKTLNFFNKLIAYLGETTERIVTAITELGAGKADDRLLLSQYITMSLPDRTTYESGSSQVTGMAFKDMAHNDTDKEFVSTISTIKDIIDVFKAFDAGTGTDLVFSGAEIEYILMGSKSEVINQAGTFFQIYFIRMLFDVAPVMLNKFVSQLATEAGSVTYGIGTVLVYAAYIITEPYIDTCLIAGGVEMPLVKYTDDVFLTPEGIPDLIKHMTDFAMSKTAQEELKKEGEKLTGKKVEASTVDTKKTDASKKKSLDINVDVGYTTYCFILILLQNDTGTTLTRLRNLIDLEAGEYYSTKGKTFDIGKTYTYLQVDVTGKFSPILPLEPMSASAFKEIKSTQYRGY